ncbi:hypothetical protein [Methanobacterium sp. ACI-7]|uniref:hypothetical protein n=1 Tax=unclassified Methanobacterium TaxID=2627676 RepID=UPI0039C33D92
MFYKTLIFGTNLMMVSSIMSVKTSIVSIPWRRNLLTIAWLIGFILFWIGSKSLQLNYKFREDMPNGTIINQSISY